MIGTYTIADIFRNDTGGRVYNDTNNKVQIFNVEYQEELKNTGTVDEELFKKLLGMTSDFMSIGDILVIDDIKYRLTKQNRSSSGLARIELTEVI